MEFEANRPMGSIESKLRKRLKEEKGVITPVTEKMQKEEQDQSLVEVRDILDTHKYETAKTIVDSNEVFNPVEAARKALEGYESVPASMGVDPSEGAAPLNTSVVAEASQDVAPVQFTDTRMFNPDRTQSGTEDEAEAGVESTPTVPASVEAPNLESVPTIIDQLQEVPKWEQAGYSSKEEAAQALQISAELKALKGKQDEKSRTRVAELKNQIRTMLGEKTIDIASASQATEVLTEKGFLFEQKLESTGGKPVEIDMTFDSSAIADVARDFADSQDSPQLKRFQDLVGGGGTVNLRFVGKSADGRYEFIAPEAAKKLEFSGDSGETARDHIISLSASAVERALTEKPAITARKTS
ncbi:MAG: hypothetical protein Q8P30_02480 [Candidatus Uhrbacteria bacterium]|nr:hypothetical protein [Candidatus Uhrbacteria bacterium]